MIRRNPARSKAQKSASESDASPENSPPVSPSGRNLPIAPTEEDAPRAGHPALARLYEEEQRVDGRYRWSVGSARPRCSACREEIPAETPFHTVLVEAEREESAQLGDPLEVFERRDLCEACFEAAQAEESEEQRFFAFWKSVLPPTEVAPLKRVNLASLRAYFDRMLDAVDLEEAEAEGSEPTGEDAEGGVPGSGDSLEEPESGSPRSEESSEVGDGAAGSKGAAAEAEAEAEASEEPVNAAGAGEPGGVDGGSDAATAATTLAYLLGLFLVRKRNLRWVGTRHGQLTLRCPQAEREYQLSIPVLTDAELEAGVGAFEELFG